MKKKVLNVLTLASKISAVTFTFLFGVVEVGGSILLENESNVTKFLGEKTYEMVAPSEDYDEEDTIYYNSDFSNLKEVKASGEAVAMKIAEEGFTLLKNDKKTLPLSSGDKVNMYSMSSYDPIYNGTGDAGRALDNKSTSLYDGLSDAGLVVNKKLFNWYKSNYNTYGRKQNGKTLRETGDAIYKQYSINDASWDEINTTSKNDEAEAGIFVLSRIAGEGADVTLNYSGYSSDMTNGNYLRLSQKEKDVLKNMKQLKDNGKLNKIIIVLNFSNQVECDFIDDELYDIDAAIWVGNMGQKGADALGKVLVGEVNPSGKLVDTFWKSHQYNPVLTNFGPANTSGSTFQFSNYNGLGDGADRYVAYAEGIYVGYRYTETRYEDATFNKEKVGNFNYDDVVSYPFGYGLSYTTFAYSNFNVEKVIGTTESYKLSVDVKNTGNVAGKESVQFYISKPYTQYDIDNGIEKSSVDLIGFEKTKLLKPGETQTLTYKVDGDVMASYDSYKAKTYIVDAGNYYFTVGHDAHNATNNVIAAKGGINVDKIIDIGGFGKGNSALTKKIVKEFDDKTYSKSKYTGVEITNQFDDVDMLTYDGAGNNRDNMKYITRNNWNDTVKLAWSDYEKGEWANNEIKLEATEKMKEDWKLPVLEKDKNPNDIKDVTYGAERKYSIIDLQSDDIAFDDEKWDELLNQLSFEETCDLVGYGLGFPSIESISLPATWDMDSAVGVSEKYFGKSSTQQSFANHYKDPDRAKTRSTSYPGNDLVAATYNIRLMEEEGESWGEDMLWMGYTAIYGPGVNLHRSPYGGRNYNYFSEDGLLTGIGCTYISKGVRAKGGHVLPKHLFLNEQETNRIGGTTWCNEQAIREIYLKCIEQPLASKYTQGVMTGLERIGMKFCGHQGYCNNVFRNEFGQVGYNTTDSTMGYMNIPYGIMTGQDCDIYGGAQKLKQYRPENGYKSYAIELRNSAHRILYSLVHSSAMNFMAPGMKVVKLTPKWLSTLNTCKITTTTLFSLSMAFLGFTLVLNVIEKYGKKKETN